MKEKTMSLWDQPLPLKATEFHPSEAIPILQAIVAATPSYGIHRTHWKKRENSMSHGFTCKFCGTFSPLAENLLHAESCPIQHAIIFLRRITQ